MKPLKRFMSLLLIVAVITTLFIGPAFVVEAKTKKNGIVVKSGHMYIYKNGKVQTGYFKYKGKTYYGHKTSSAKYPKGSVTQGEIRIKGNKWYAFGSDGARVEKDQYARKGRRSILTLDIRGKNHTVRSVYMTANTQRGIRYNTSKKKWQKLGDDDKWHSYGKKTIPDFVDRQK